MSDLARLGHVEVLDVWGKPVFFRELWEGKTTVLALVRHFGCIFCHEQVARLVEMEPSLRAAGAHLVVLGNGNPAHANEFMRWVGLTGGVYTDPARILYRELDMHRGVRRSINLEATRNLRRALRAGFRQRGTRGDPWQLGGVLLVDPKGRIVFAHRSQVVGDHCPVPKLLEQLGSPSSGS